MRLRRARPWQRARGAVRRVVRRPADVEAARYQWVHIQIWLATTLACLLGFALATLLRHHRPFSLLWLLFALFTGTATTVVARWPRLRGAVSAGIYAIVLTFSALTFVVGQALPDGPGYAGLLAVLVGATVAEAPRRSVWMGGVCLALILGNVVLHPHQDGLVGESTAMAMAVVGLVFCGIMAANLWRRALDEMNERAQENIELTCQLRRAEQELEARVAARTEELIRRSRDLGSRMADLRHALLEQERLQNDLAELAVRDELTGLHNRRHFMDSLDTLAHRAGTFSLLLIDIDHFKSINDTFGHPVGDQTLVALTRQLADCIRADDVLARVGGEEFAVLLPGTAQFEAVAVAEQMRARVERHAWSSVLQGRGVTISVGVAGTARGDYVIPSKLMTRADRALYRAKTTGRNRVVEDRSFDLSPQLGAGT